MAMESAPTTPYIFVSYASADRDRVMPVVETLRHAGVAVWLDQHDIAGGTDYAREIAEGIEGCAALVLMSTPASLASRNVRQEIALGWKFERPYLPLLLEPVTIPKEIAYWLETAQWIEVFDRPDADWLPAVLTALATLGIAPDGPDAAPLAGREHEQTILRSHLAAATNGQGSLILIGGEAGIGKTTLAEALCREAGQQRATILTGRCFDLTETPPYGPWVYLFARYTAAQGLPPLPDAFATPGVVGTVASQGALFQQVQGFLADLTVSRPAVVLLDDYHWADPVSLDLLRFLAQSIATLPVLLLVTYRTDELTRRHPLYHLLPTLVREAQADRLDLRPLAADDVRAVIAARYDLPDADVTRLATYVAERSEGNPFFAGELLRTLEEEAAVRHTDDGWRLGDITRARVPMLLRQVIDGRLARLGEDSQPLLAIAAVIGQEVPLDLWATVAESDEDALLETIERGVEARLLEESPDGTRVRFVHALIREALYEGIPGIRRRRMHRQVGEALVATVNPDPDAVAYHFQQAGDARAVTWLVSAGDRAERAHALLTAAARFEAALGMMEHDARREGERGWLLFRLACLLRYWDTRKGLAYLTEAAHLAASLKDDALAACTTFVQGLLACYAGEVESGLAALEVGAAAIQLLSDEQRAFVKAQTEPTLLGFAIQSPWGLVATWYANVGRFREAQSLVEELLATPFANTETKTALANAYACLGMPEEALAMFRQTEREHRNAGQHVRVSVSLLRRLCLVLLPYYTEEVAERRRVAREAEEAAVRAGDALGELPSRIRFPLLALEGEWNEAERRVSSNPHVLDEQRATGLIALRTLASWRHARGDTNGAWSIVHAYFPDGAETKLGTRGLTRTVAAQQVAALLALDAGNLALARQWIEAHDRWLAWSGAVLGQSEGQALWAAYYRAAGDAATAYEHAERALAHASEPRQPLALLAAHRLLGELDTDAGRDDAAATHLAASLALAEACAAPYERALTLLAMAEFHAATGENAAARLLLDEVRAICTPLGAKPALARTDALAARLVP
ncbi:MAG: AAA family ATPase [Thermomicrobiales bacterium]